MNLLMSKSKRIKTFLGTEELGRNLSTLHAEFHVAPPTNNV